jgi:site-specific DNA-methyltransferase (adenine-specific)
VELGAEVVLWTGECAAVMAAHIPDASIDLTITSPPYDLLRTYHGFTFDFEAIAAQLWRVTKPGGVVVWVVGDATVNGSETGTSFRQALRFMELGFNLHDTMIYEKNGPSYPDSVRYYQVFEYMFVFSKGAPKSISLISDRENKYLFPWGRKTQRDKDALIERKTYYKGKPFGPRFNIWKILGGKGFSTSDDAAYNHSAIFPEALARDHILSWSNPGDLVLDPMCGSGTTLKMALQYGRRCIGIDISAEYIELSRERIEKALQQPRLFQPDAVAPPPQQAALFGGVGE